MTRPPDRPSDSFERRQQQQESERVQQLIQESRLLRAESLLVLQRRYGLETAYLHIKSEHELLCIRCGDARRRFLLYE